MKGCALCPRRCGVDRSRERGACRSGDDVLVGAVVAHRGEEPPLVTGSGSGAVFFCGCPLRCAYCQNRQISQLCRGRVMTGPDLARAMMKLEEAGCTNINLVSPTHYTPWVIESIGQARDLGMELPVVLNSGGYETIPCLEQWRGHAGIYLMDLKYGDNETGRVLSGVPDYWDTAREVIAYLWEAAGTLEVDPGGRAVRGLLVRHLVLPGMRSNPFAVLEFLAEISPGIPVSIMSQYNPAFYDGELPDMRRPLGFDEYRVVLERAFDLGFETIYYQDLDAPGTYNPDFTAERPFDDVARIL